jgi:hypothetical protein
MHSVYEQLHQATGKTIAKVRFGDDPSSDRRVHQGEYIIFEFTDGTELEIKTGSNGQQLMDAHFDCRKTGRPVLNASDLHFSYVVLFRERATAGRGAAQRAMQDHLAASGRTV